MRAKVHEHISTRARGDPIAYQKKVSTLAFPFTRRPCSMVKLQALGLDQNRSA